MSGRWGDTTVESRFWARVEKSEDASDCWLWVGKIRPDGYVNVKVGTRQTLAHRWAYTQLVGPIPVGLTLDHNCHDPETCDGGPACKHRRCVNPAHLEPVTGRENTLRGNNRGAINARKTHCANDHEFTEANTYWSTDGRHRKCRTCEHARGQRRAAARRAAA